MRLLHFAQKPTLRRSLATVSQVAGAHDRHPMWKPRGLWVTPEGDEHDWSWWARAEHFRLEDLRYALEVRLRRDARVLHLETAQDVREFAESYPGVLREELVAVTENFPGDRARFRRDMSGINWHAVSLEYQGIIVAPYQWSLRMDPDFFWYYPWDCASGCIWNAEAVESVTHRPDVSVVTEAEIRRSIHTRMRYTRRKMKKSMRRMRVETARLERNAP